MAQSPKWRLIDKGSAPGLYHMSTDMAMAKLARQINIPTLRLYTWNPPAISLGYHQSCDDIDLQRCSRDNIDVVVRPTGGRAILHHHELTYAVVLAPTHPLYHEDIRAVYEWVSRCLTTGLKQLNIPVTFDRVSGTPKDFNKGDRSSLCYASSVQYEIRAGSRKLVGSAQRRVNQAVLQHGSILIGPEHLNIVKYLNRGDDSRKNSVGRYMQRHKAYLQEFAPVDVKQVREAVIYGFEKELGIRFEPGDLSEAEVKLAQDLQQRFSTQTGRNTV